MFSEVTAAAVTEFLAELRGMRERPVTDEERTKARAILHGRYHAAVSDVQAVAKPALRHRIAGNYTAQANGINSEQLIEMLMNAVPADKKYERPAA